MQGIITTPDGDVWALDNENSQIVHLPKGDAAKGRILGGTVDGKPVDGTLQFKEPFHLAVDQRDRIWVTNTDDTVTRFPANGPRKAEHIKVGLVPRSVAIDSLGDAGHQRLGPSPHQGEVGPRRDDDQIETGRHQRLKDRRRRPRTQMWIDLYDMAAKYPGGDVSMVDPDSTVVVTLMAGGASTRPGASPSTATTTCGSPMRLAARSRTSAEPDSRTARPARKTGNPISHPGGYLGGVRRTTDVAIDPAGNVWVANNWDRPDEGFEKEPDSAFSTRFGGNGTVVFYGLAKPVKTPLIGPPQAP